MKKNSLLAALETALSNVTSSSSFAESNLSLATEVGKRNSNRSSLFIDMLHEALIPLFPDPNYAVLSKTKRSEMFRRSEFLFDITVVKFKKVKSHFTTNQVNVITDSMVQVESEFALDLNQTMIDFSKLLCGLAPIKMMVMPFYKDDQLINEWLLEHVFNDEMRIADKAVYYLAYVQHPDLWSENIVPHFELFKCVDQEIEKLSGIVSEESEAIA